MSQFEIILGDSWRDNLAYLQQIHPRRPADQRIDLGAIRDVIDIVIDDQNVTSYVEEERLFEFFHILTDELVGLLTGQKLKSIIEFPSQPWELVIFPAEDSFLISVYSIDRQNRIVTHNKPVPEGHLSEAVIDTSETILRALYETSESFSSRQTVRAFSNKLAELKELTREGVPEREPPHDIPSHGLHHGNISRKTGLTLQYWLDAGARGVAEYCGEHKFDFHALLAPGEIVIEHDRHEISLAYDYPILFVERILAQLRELLNSVESPESDVDAPASSGPNIAFYQTDDDNWRVEVSTDRDNDSLTFHGQLDEVFDLFLSSAQMILRDFLELNPKMELNHRFSDIVGTVEELEQWRAEQTSSNVYHNQPEAYIEDLGHWEPMKNPSVPKPGFEAAFESVDHLFPRMRWEEEYENIGFQLIQPTRTGLLVPTHHGLFLHDWETGRVRWRLIDEEGFSFSPIGEKLLIARDKKGLQLLDLEEQESIFEQRELSVSSWRHLVDAAEYPDQELIIAVDSYGRISGLDSQTGERKWHFGAKHGRFAGVAFEGPLVTALSAEGFLYALNPQNGELLWKIRLGGLTEHAPVFHQGRLYVFSRDAVTQKSTIHAFFPFTGREAWRARFNSRIAGPVSFADRWALIPGERAGQLMLQGIDLEATQPGVGWQLPLASAGIDPPSEVVETKLDGRPHGIIKTDRHELTCLELLDGQVRWQANLEDEQSFYHQNVPIIQIRDAVLAAGKKLQLRAIETGECLHQLNYPVQRPVFLAASGQLKVTVGEMGSSSSLDKLVVFDLNHFLTEIGENQQ